MPDRPHLSPALAGATVVDIPVLGGGVQTHRPISWSAIFGGVILVVIVKVLLSLLGAGIGFGTVNVNAGTAQNASSLGIGGGIWWVISSCLALFVGGYVAAWLAGVRVPFDGLMHGLLTWGIAILLTIYLLTSAIGGIIGGGFSALGSAASMAGSGLGNAAKPLAQAAGVTPDVVQEQAQAYLQPASPDPATMTPQDAQKEIARNLVTFASGGADAPAAKDSIIKIIAAQMKISPDDATKRFNAAQAKLQQAKDKAVQTAKNAADASASAASMTSFAAFGVLLLGGLASAVGGSRAVERRLRDGTAGLARSD